uniref:Uncharacterized protein n=1 Tax=Plectus sambesii TaxID=2011161 RepID=A0A914W2A3_9BILA
MAKVASMDGTTSMNMYLWVKEEMVVVMVALLAVVMRAILTGQMLAAPVAVDLVTGMAEMDVSSVIAEVATMVEVEAIMVWEALEVLEVDQEAILVDLVEKELQMEAVVRLEVKAVLAALVELMVLKALGAHRRVGIMKEVVQEELEA